MKPVLLFLLALACLPLPSMAQNPTQDDWSAHAARAEAHFQFGSFALAQEDFASALAVAPESEKRWLTFREADARLRSLDSAKGRDGSLVDAAVKDLTEFASGDVPEHKRDRVWAEAQEALGDHHWQNRRQWGLGHSWGHYQAALEWWASSSDIETARRRWLGIVQRIGWPKWNEGDSSYGNRNNWVPMETLEQGLKIAVDPDDRARLHFMIARNCMNQSSGPWWDRRMQTAFQEIRKIGKDHPFAIHAKWFEAQWLENTGPWTRDGDGQATRIPDPAGALALYRELVGGRLIRGPYSKSAKKAIERILKQELQIRIDQAFLPGSKVGFHLQARNLEKVNFALYPVRLHEVVKLDGAKERAGQWLKSIEIGSAEALHRFEIDAQSKHPHAWVQRTEALPHDLEIGAYLLRANSDGLSSQALVLVTEAGLVLKAGGDQLFAWVTDAETGKPIAGQTVHAKVRIRDAKGNGSWRNQTQDTPENGLSHFQMAPSRDNYEHFVSVETPKGPAFAVVSNYVPREDQRWRIHVVTDRPAYRPDQKVQWKLAARLHSGLEYETPAGRKLTAKLVDPRGGEIDQVEVTLSPFGSAFGTFETGSAMPLGQYTLQLQDESGSNVGSAQLFRLEEYKRPEFEVTVSTAKAEDGRASVFVLGDEVHADIEASTYFGSAVAGAKVEVVLYQTPFTAHPTPRGRFHWFADTLTPDWEKPGYHSRWNRNEIQRTELITDAEGKAQLKFNTPYGQGQEYTYTIEARVTDASRREVTGSGQVRVRRQAYSAELELDHKIYQPGSQAKVTVHTKDANDVPLPVTGKLHLYRARWVEVWMGFDRMPVPADQLRRARAEGNFPPPGWVRKRAEFVFEEIDSLSLATNDKGTGSWAPNLPSEGVYQFRWVSQDERSGEVVAEAWTFAASAESSDLALKADGLQILLDNDAVAEGENAQVLVVSDATDRHILFTVEAEQVMHVEVLHLTGNVKLVTLPLTKQHVPNVNLSATEVRGGHTRTAGAQLIVPPAKHFLDVNVTLDQETYRPGSDGTFHVTVLDHDGKPVQAEVSLSLYDGSLLAIAKDQIEDPRAFFWGHRRNAQVAQGSSFDQLRYIKLVQDDQGRLMTPEDLRERLENEQWDAEDLNETRKRGKQRTLGRTQLAATNSPAGRSARAESLETMDMALEAGGYDSSHINLGVPLAQGNGEPQTITVRSDFRETAVWLPSLTTDADGKASGSFTLPDSTTRWQLNVFGGDSGDRFGQFRESAARTELPLIMRPQMPRFLVNGDTARISALLTNTTDTAIPCEVAFATEGLEILGYFDGENLKEGTSANVTVPANGDARVDYLVKPTAIGDAKLTLSALGSETSDAVLRTLPVIEHGIEVFVADSGRLADASIEHTFTLPEGREGTTHMEVRITPSIATTMLDALPYLTDFPYGCLEQSLSRFVPTAIAIRTMETMGLDPEWIAEASFGGIETEYADKTQPRGDKNFAKFREAAAAGIAKVEGEQRGDGSWAWWPGGPSNRWMSGYAAWSLALAKEANLEVSDSTLSRALDWIRSELVREGMSTADRVWLLHAGCAVMGAIGAKDSDRVLAKAFEGLYQRRGDLVPYGRALLTLSAKMLGRADELPTLVDNLHNGVTFSDNTGALVAGTPPAVAESMAHWGHVGPAGRGYHDPVESTAFTLRALLACDPQNELIQPAMNWLVKNRRGAQWKSTKDTAIVVLALCDYLQVSGEVSKPIAFRVHVDGELLDERRLEGRELLLGPVRLPVPNAAAGEHTIRIERTEGDGPLYWNVSGRLFSAENPIKAHGADFHMRREVYRLVGRDTLLKGKVYERVLLKDGDTVQSGERLEVALYFGSGTDLEYIMVRDNKPAGLEATVLQSGGGLQARELRKDEVWKLFGKNNGYAEHIRATGDAPQMSAVGKTGASRWVYRELRDQAQVMFIDSLPAGTWEIRTTLRAETPGTYHALPAIGQAMYVPEVRANCEEIRLTVAPE